MKIKDKIAIGLIILSIVLFGIALNGLAYDINNKNLDDLAYQAANDSNGFMSVSVHDWANKTISPGDYKSGNYKSGICMYHVQSNNGNSAYKITDILDFSFDGKGIQLSRNGYTINTNDSTGTLAKTLYTAYSTGEYYSEKNWGSTGVKENVIAAFSQAVQQGGVQATSSFYTNIRSDDKAYFNKSVDQSYGASAKNYKSVTKNIQDSAITVQHEGKSAEGYTMIGPFNINFAGKGISQIGIYSDQKEFVNGNGGGIYYSTYHKTIDGVGTNIANGDQGWSNTISNIPSGVDFYIIVSDKGEEFSKGNNLRVTIYQQGMEYYHARLVLAQNPKAQGQNMGIFAAEQKYYTGEQTFNITKSTPIDLTVVKYGNNNVKQAGVNFRLSNGSLSGTWGNRQEQNGVTVYSDITFGNWEDTDRQIFTTGSAGKFIVKDLDVTYVYSLQETWNPNAGYSTVNIKNATLSNGVASVGLENTVETNKVTKNLVTGIKLSSTQDNVLEIIDKGEDIDSPLELTVVKYGNNNVKQAGVNFRLSNGSLSGTWGNRQEQNGVTVYSDITFGNWEDTDRQIFTTGSAGKFIVKDLDVTYVYSLQETWNPNAGYSTVDIKNATLSNGVASVGLGNTVETNKRTNNLVTGIKLSSTQANILEIIDKREGEPNVDTFNIEINKTKLNGKTALGGAEFRIKVLDEYGEALGWLEKESDRVYNYDSDYEDATIWSSTYSKSTKKGYVYAKTTGQIKITDLNTEYQYEIYETKQGNNGYSLSSQITSSSSSSMSVKINGEKVKDIEYIKAASKSTSSNDYAATDASIYCGVVSYEENGSDVEVLVTNRIKTGGGNPNQYLYINGKIWIDKKDGKQKVYNDLYDSNTEGLYNQAVKVSLVNSSGTTIQTITTTNGTYSLYTGIAITSSTNIANTLSGYYLKFEYSDKYSTVSPKFTEQNGSKALAQEGTDGVAYIYNLSDYADKFYNYPTLDHMNMGLIGIEDSDYEVNQNIAYVKVVINGYTYTYEYGGTGDTTKTAAPTVNWKNGSAYTRAIYPSDIAYSDGNDWNEDSIQIYVVYRININNTNMTNYGKKKSSTTSPVSYVEVDLKVTNLTNTYDTDRYELETNNDSKSNEDFKNWTDTGNTGTATYTGNKLDNGIVPNKPRTIYIQFKVKKEAIQNLLNQKESYENNPTIAKTEAYHNYWKASYEWEGVGENRKPVLKFKDKKTDTYVKTASAYYLRLKINTERTITGTVFEDENIYTNGEHLGDGMYGNKKDGSKENTISNVKVELLSKNGAPAKLYSSSNDYNEKDAETVSATDGTYSFVGVTPGKYYVRFTYGDGNQKICSLDTSDNTYKETNNKVSIADYKSTAVTESCIQSALGYEFEDKFKAGEDWYKHKKHPSENASKLYSTATDNLEQRAEYNNDKTARTSIQANTALMTIGLENTENNISTVSKTFEEDIYKETILGINFGIIDLPEVSLAFDKVVSNIKITNAQGNILVEGNPATQNIKYVSNLDEIDHSMVKGSRFTKSEINEEELYGSTLELTYSITVQNNSEVNYYEDSSNKYYGYYYMFGDSDNSKEVTITVENVLDYIDPVIKYENISIDDKHKITKVKASDNQAITNSIQAETSLTYDYVVDITEWKALYTTKNKDKTYGSDKTQDTAELTVTRLLSAEDDDLGVSNVAQVIKIKNTPALVETVDASKVYFNDPVYTNPAEEVYVTITPPTGEDRFTTMMYIVVEIIALSALTAGIVLIKKKVIDK